MRNIKYRAYIKHLKIIMEVQRINFHYKTVEWYIVHPDEWYLSEFSFEDIHLNEFTWFKDKNGKEIYEWDIVASPWFWKITEVWYDNWSFYPKIFPEYSEVIWNIYHNFDLLK